MFGNLRSKCKPNHYLVTKKNVLLMVVSLYNRMCNRGGTVYCSALNRTNFEGQLNSRKGAAQHVSMDVMRSESIGRFFSVKLFRYEPFG